MVTLPPPMTSKYASEVLGCELPQLSCFLRSHPDALRFDAQGECNPDDLENLRETWPSIPDRPCSYYGCCATPTKAGNYGFHFCDLHALAFTIATGIDPYEYDPLA